MNGSMLRSILTEGDVSPGDEPGKAHIESTFMNITFTLVVALKPGNDGVHTIVTLFHSRR